MKNLIVVLAFLSCISSFASDAQLQKCETALNAFFGSTVVTRGPDQNFLRGFANARYSENSATAFSIILETATEAYFYAETSDISAEIDTCDKATSKIVTAVSGHRASCDDLPMEKIASQQIIYSDCAAI